MNTQHTPGPWRLGFDPSRAHDDETTIWAGTEAVGNAITKEPQLHIPHIKQAHANARLMAAAPELLEALKELIAANEEADAAFSRYRGSCEDDPHFTAKQKRMEYARGRQDGSRESARAAIAKATQP